MPVVQYARKLKKLVNDLWQLKINCLMWICVVFFIIFLSFKYSNKNNAKPTVLWWTKGFPDTQFTIKSCGSFECVVTNDRTLTVEGKTAYLFYASNIEFEDLPLPRKYSEIWGLFHEESPRNVISLTHEKALNLFNYSSTFSRYSDVPFVLQGLGHLRDITSANFYVSTKEKNDALVDIAPVLYIQSDCDTITERDNYVEELMKHIKVDSYGACLNNKELLDNLKGEYLIKLEDDTFFKFVARYKFTIAIENGVCEDYITEKLWRPITVGSVPLYYGSQSVSDWLPNEKSAILIQEYSSPKQLAEYLHVLLSNDSLYEKHLEHKIKSEIRNKKLVKEFNKVPYASDTLKVAEDFECFVCKKLHQGGNLASSIVTKEQYNCPKPKSVLPDVKSENSWLYSWVLAEKESNELYQKVLNSAIKR